MTPYEQFVARHGGGPAFREPGVSRPSYETTACFSTCAEGIRLQRVRDEAFRAYHRAIACERAELLARYEIAVIHYDAARRAWLRWGARA
jgi:hypothetical protein